MSEDTQKEKIDKVLEVLAKSISTKILATLVGIDPGKLKEDKDLQNGDC